MQLTLEENPGIHTVRSHAPGRVQVGERQFTRPFAISPRTLLDQLPASSLAELDAPALAAVLALQPRILLLGVDCPVAPGAPRALRNLLEERGIALDVMNLGAACRTYDVLAGERREVAAVLLLTP